MSLCLFLVAAGLAQALRYDPAYEEWNLNTNQEAIHPLDYTGTRAGHKYTPSPSNWRFPFYTVMLDRWVNGDPSNDNANGTLFEQDVWSTQLRHGGDVQGLVDSLDYLQGMGIKVLSPRSTRDVPCTDTDQARAFTLLDHHSSTNLGDTTCTRYDLANPLYYILSRLVACPC